MASFTDRIKIVLEIDDTGGTKAFTRFRDSIKAAEGATGKFKAAVSGAMQHAKDHSLALAATGGAALVAFSVKAVHAFEETAKAAIDLGTATGLSTQAASEWIAVGDDFQVTAGQLQSGIGRIAKSLNDTKWAEYGIQTRDAAGQARSTNDILIDSLATLSSITNATERARVGNDLFGKGFANLSPLIGHTRDEYKDMLGAVSDGQRITDAEAKKAEQMRLAEDALSDSLKDVELALGGVVARFAPLIDKTATLTSGIVRLVSEVDQLPAALEAGFGIASANPVAIYDAAVSAATDTVDLHSLSLEELKKTLDDAGISGDKAAAIIESWAKANGVAADTIPELVTSEDLWTDAVKAAQDAADAAVKKVKELVKAREDLIAATLSSIDAEYAYVDQARSTNDAVAEYTATLGDSKATEQDIITAQEKARQSMVDTARAYADASGEAENTDGYVKAMIDSLVNQAITLDPSSPLRQAIQGYIDQLRNIPGVVSTEFQVKGPNVTVGGHQVASVPRRAGGGPVTAGQPYIVGEQGQELFVPGASGQIIPAAQTRRVLSGSNIVATGGGISANRPIAAAAASEAEAAPELAKTERDAAKDQRDLWALQYEFAEISREEYRKLLQGQLGDVEKYSDGWVQLKREMRSLDKEDADDRAATAKAQADDEAARLKADNDALKKSLEERQKIFDDARAKRAASDAEDAAQRAVSDLAAAGNAFRNAKAADKADAYTDLGRAIDQAAEALYQRADRRANAAGLADDTVEWSRYVRAALEQDATNDPRLSNAIARILSGIPQLASGGIVSKPTLALIGERGPEAVVPLGSGAMGALVINTGLDERRVVEIIRRYQRKGGQL